MFYVYIRFLKTGKENYLCCFEYVEDAIHKIASCYSIDTRMGQLGDYYYFMKQH